MDFEMKMSDRAFSIIENLNGIKADYCFSYKENGVIYQKQGYSPYMVGKIIDQILDQKNTK